MDKDSTICNSTLKGKLILQNMGTTALYFIQRKERRLWAEK